MGHQQSIRAYGIQIVVGYLHSRPAVAPVMVIPLLGAHEGGNAEANQCRRGSYGGGVLILQSSCYPRIYGGNSEADPYCEGIERAGIGIIPLPDLERRLVEVHHNSYSRHEKEQESQPAAPLVPVELEQQAK